MPHHRSPTVSSLEFGGGREPRMIFQADEDQPSMAPPKNYPDAVCSQPEPDWFSRSSYMSAKPISAWFAEEHRATGHRRSSRVSVGDPRSPSWTSADNLPLLGVCGLPPDVVPGGPHRAAPAVSRLPLSKTRGDSPFAGAVAPSCLS